MRETKNVIARTVSVGQLRADPAERLRSVHALRINSLTIRGRPGYKCVSSSTEDHDADDEDPDN